MRSPMMTWIETTIFLACALLMIFGILLTGIR